MGTRLATCTAGTLAPPPSVGHVTGDMKRRESNETRKRTAPKLPYVAKGLKYGLYHHDDVMQISTLICQNLVGGKEFHNSKIESQRTLYKGSGAFPFLCMSKKLVKL